MSFSLLIVRWFFVRLMLWYGNVFRQLHSFALLRCIPLLLRPLKFFSFLITSFNCLSHFTRFTCFLITRFTCFSLHPLLSSKMFLNLFVYLSRSWKNPPIILPVPDTYCSLLFRWNWNFSVTLIGLSVRSYLGNIYICLWEATNINATILFS
jgi:hypothetical protein